MLYKNLEYVIRLQRGGRIRRPFWRIVVQKKLYGISRAPIAIIGSYNRFQGFSRFKSYIETKEKIKYFSLVFINFEILEYWLMKGARPSIRVAKIIF